MRESSAKTLEAIKNSVRIQNRYRAAKEHLREAMELLSDLEGEAVEEALSKESAAQDAEAVAISKE